MKNLFIVFILVLSFTANAQTKSVKKSAPLLEDSAESVSMSSERLARIDDMLKESVLNGDIPGVVALIARDGKIVYHKAFGMADNSSDRSLKPDDIFRIASQSKAITATAVMMLWEEGKFLLDDPISKYIPEFKNPQVLDTFQGNDTSYTTVAASREITIRHLLTHTSGIGRASTDWDERFKKIYEKTFGVYYAITSEDMTIEEFVKKLARLPLHHNPGEEYTYGLNYHVLGYLIEVVSGMPFDIFLKERLFEPLGMYDTWFYLPEDKAHRLVSLQMKSDNGDWERIPVTDLDWDYPIKGAKKMFSGDGGLCSTAKDYATFLQMYLNGGELNGIRILSRATIEHMMVDQIDTLWGEGINTHIGLGFYVINHEKGGKPSIFDSGTFYTEGAFTTTGFADPKEKIIGVLMKQTLFASENTMRKFCIMCLTAIDE
jgi:CubicO group peptidase (beta-lactamase class C family)